MTVKVLLADDSEVMLRAVSRFLEGRAEIKLLGTASNFTEMVEMTDVLQPELLVVDLRMSRDAAGEAILFRTARPDLKILAITAATVDDADSMDLAEKIGAHKVLGKMELTNTLIPAILELVGHT